MAPNPDVMVPATRGRRGRLSYRLPKDDIENERVNFWAARIRKLEPTRRGVSSLKIAAGAELPQNIDAILRRLVDVLGSEGRIVRDAYTCSTNRRWAVEDVAPPRDL